MWISKFDLQFILLSQRNLPSRLPDLTEEASLNTPTGKCFAVPPDRLASILYQ